MSDDQDTSEGDSEPQDVPYEVVSSDIDHVIHQHLDRPTWSFRRRDLGTHHEYAIIDDLPAGPKVIKPFNAHDVEELDSDEIATWILLEMFAPNRILGWELTILTPILVIVYFLCIGTFTAMFGFFGHILSYITTFLASLFLAILFDPLVPWLRGRIDREIYTKRSNLPEVLGRLAEMTEKDWQAADLKKRAERLSTHR